MEVTELATKDAIAGAGHGTNTAPQRGRTRPTAEVVLLTQDSRAQLERTLPVLRTAARAAGAELLFVDLGSRDGTREYVAGQAAGGRGVWMERSDRPRDALAAAAAASTAEVLVFLEPTVTPTSPDALTSLLDHLGAALERDLVAPPAPGVLAIRRVHLLELLRRDDADLDIPELRERARTVDGPPRPDWHSLEAELVAGPGTAGPAFRTTRPVVLHVVESFAAGTERHVLDLIRHTREFDHVLAIPSYHQGQSTAQSAAVAESFGARVERVEMGRYRAPHRHMRALAALRELIECLRPDVVHGHSSIGGAMARLAAIGFRCPVVYTPHAPSRSRWALAAERLLATRTHRLIAVSESEREFMLAHRLAEQRQVVVIPNGIELEPPPPLDEPLRARLGISPDTKLIGCVGRLSWQKAPEVFVSACSILAERLPDAHFVLIGSGPLQALVEKAIRVTGLEERFHLVPGLPGAAAALAELDVYALPSRFEGGPYTPMEAMRAGTPVVVTGVPGNRDLVEHWKSGLVVPPDEPYALATAILTVLQDAGLRDRLVEGARRSLDRFEVRSMAADTSAVYRELCQRESDRAQADPGEELGVGAHAARP